MKPLTTEQQIKALAELDGFTGWWCEGCHNEVPPSQVSYEETHSDPLECGGKCGSKPYLTSYDAIIPLVQKQPEIVQDRIKRELSQLRFWIKATPTQLCEALLRATGKWKD